MSARTVYAPRICMGGLALVSAAHPISEPEAWPPRVPVTVGGRTVELETRTANLLMRLLGDIRSADEIVPVDGYRSAQTQRQLYDRAMAEHGEAFTRAFVAPPGGSEHQTGLAVDLAGNAAHIDPIRPLFPDAGVCGLFRRRAAAYGFVERYPSGKERITGIAYEPWHFRYVGHPHARIMSERGLCLEEYIELLRQYRYDGEHLWFSEKPRRFEIFYVPERQFGPDAVPDCGCYQVSGNNVDGFIVTVWRGYV